MGVESKLVFDGDYADGFPSRKIGNWFQTKKKFSKLIDEFKPDAIFVDRQRHFGINALKANIPLFVLLRGHYWSEIYWNKRTMYKPLHKRIALWQWDKLGKEIFNGATAIFPICKYLEKITNKFVPDKSTKVFFEGVDASRWYQVKGMNLKHPCVGLLQRASWWGKTSEMLILKKVLEKMLEIPGKVFSRDDIGKIINISKERTIDVMITRLRQKIESNPKNPKYLQTIRGSGYVLWIK